jgi:hypothetical protein
MSLCFRFLNEFDYGWMDTETKDLTFVFDDLFFSDRQLELFNGLDSHKLA